MTKTFTRALVAIAFSAFSATAAQASTPVPRAPAPAVSAEAGGAPIKKSVDVPAKKVKYVYCMNEYRAGSRVEQKLCMTRNEWQARGVSRFENN